MKNTFSKECKTEALDNFKFSNKDCCNQSFLKGYFYRENIDATTENIRHKPDVYKSSKVLKKLLGRYDISAYVIEKEIEGKEPVSKLYITEREDVQRLYALQTDFEPCGDCFKHFLTGLFVSDAVISNPEKQYLLEFSYRQKELAENLQHIFSQVDMNFSITQRRSSYVIYTKNSVTIENFLAIIGAQSAFLKLVIDKSEKDLLNRKNRAANCDAANSAKTLRAGKKIIDAIYRLIDTEMLYNLSDDLQELAQLKIEKPERSLTDLGKMMKDPLTKSSVNRRLQKLCQIAQIEE